MKKAILVLLLILGITLNIKAQDETINGNLTVKSSIKLRKSDDSGTAGLALSGTGSYIHVAGAGLISRTNNQQDLGINGWRFRSLWLGSDAYIAGKVGIGTSSALEKLDVRGTIRVIPSSNNHSLPLDRIGGKATIKAINSSSNGSMVIDPASDGDAIYLGHYVNSNTYISSGGGKVGIGTSSALEKLDVRGTIRVIPSSNNHSLLLDRIGGKATIKAINSSSNGSMVIDPASDGDAIYLGHYVNSNTYISSGGGKVGIGTSSAREKLDVRGTVRVIPSSNNYSLLDRIGGKATIKAINSSSNGNMVIDPASDGDAILLGHYVNSNTYISTGGGQVGIGTTKVGSHKLAVEGSIGAREIKVESSGWSDFVFDEEYELKSLDEIEKFIIANKHLPDIPSEAEVGKKGINLGEMDAKLLQKIEELTLYLLEMKKELSEVKEKNLALEEEIKAIKGN